MRHLPGRRLLLVLAAAAVAAGAVGGIAYATGVVGASDSSTVVACVKKDGSVRIVAAASQCKKDENAVLLQAALSSQPTQFTVRCDRNQKLGSLLDQIANGTQPVTITVFGNCDEDVSIGRDFVALNGGGSGASIRSVGIYSARGAGLQNLTVGSMWVGFESTFLAYSVHFTGQVDVHHGSHGQIDASALDDGLKLDSGTLDIGSSSITHGEDSAVHCDGGSINLNGVDVSGGSDGGVEASGTCSVNINGGRVHDNAAVGVEAYESAAIRVQNGAVIENNPAGGAHAQDGGSLWITDSTVRGNGENGGDGVDAGTGGSVRVQNSTVTDNGGNGIEIAGASSGEIAGSTIQHNGNNGIGAEDSSVLTVGGNTITDNAQWGIWCQPAPATAEISGWSRENLGTVSGNGAGQVSCPFSGQPARITVDCANGDKLGDALDQVADRSEPVVFVLQGMCDEQVQINRDNVTLKPGSPDAGIRGLELNEVRGIQLWGLAIGSGGLHATASTFHAHNVHVSGGDTGIWLDAGSVGFVEGSSVENASQQGVMVQGGSLLTMNGGSVTGNSNMGIAVGGSDAVFSGVHVTGNGMGVEVSFGGSANLNNCDVDQNAGNGVHTFDGGEANVVGGEVANNGRSGATAQSGDLNLQSTHVHHNAMGGVIGMNGARITLQVGTVVEHNQGDGLTLQTGSSAEIQGGIVIQNNDGNGVHVMDNSVVSSGGDAQIVNNGGWGFWCDATPAHALIRANGGGVGTVTGNGQGGVGCQVAS